ncbi:transposase, Ptta/En/Spm, transposase, Tnp1/En/Spm-like protein [Tanacetum coccineum]
MSFFKPQQITKIRGFINRIREEANIARNLVGQLTDLIAKMEAPEDQGDIFHTLMDLRDDREAAYGSILNILQGRNELLEKIIGCVVDSGGVLELDPISPLCSNSKGIMETGANNPDDLVTYDNDNDIDDLGYESEVYLDEEDKNNHSNRNVVKRGITMLSKFRREYGKLDGIKLSLKILSWKKVGSEARDKLWDEITRYFDVDLTAKKLVMNRLGQLLRNFRTKLRRTYILPNQDTPSKLNEVPAKYTAILKAEEWVNFVKYMATQAYKVKSAAGKMARSKCLYPHTMGRGGYAHVKEQMIEKKEIEPDEEPSRGTLWLKGRVNKDEDYPDDEIRSVGDKLKETKDKIKEGTLKVDQGTDAITVVLGKEKGGYARGVGSSVTYKSQLEAARRERQEKELLIQSMSSKMSQTEGLVSLVDIHPVNSSADKEGGTTIVGCDQNDASIQKEMQKMATPPSTIQMITVENKIAPKVPTKRKNFYVSSDAMQKEANKKRSQKALVYPSSLVYTTLQFYIGSVIYIPVLLYLNLF